MNKVMLMGRLTRDPEIRYTAGDNPTTVAKWSLAVNRRYKREGEKEADFFDCAAFGKTAELVEKYWRKGMQMLLTGRLEQRQWTDREGKAKSAVQVTVEDVEFTERKAESQEHAKAPKPQEFHAEEDLPFSF